MPAIWTPPITWTAGQTITAPLLNTQVRDNLLALNASLGAGATNHLINGGLEVWQRGNGPFTATNSYTADMWKIQLGAGSSMTVTRDTAPSAGGTAQAQIVYSQGTGASLLLQVIERPVLYRTLTLSLSAVVRAFIPNAVQIQIVETNAGATNSVSTPMHPGDGTFQTLTTPPLTCSGTTQTLQVQINCVAGTSATFYIDSVMLAVSATPIAYQTVPYVDDLQRCLRWYERPLDSTNGDLAYISGYAPGVGYGLYVPLWYKAIKAATPTATISAASTWTITNGSAPALSAVTRQACGLAVNAAAAGAWTMQNVGTSSYIAVDCSP